MLGTNTPKSNSSHLFNMSDGILDLAIRLIDMKSLVIVGSAIVGI